MKACQVSTRPAERVIDHLVTVGETGTSSAAVAVSEAADAANNSRRVAQLQFD